MERIYEIFAHVACFLSQDERSIREGIFRPGNLIIGKRDVLISETAGSQVSRVGCYRGCSMFFLYLGVYMVILTVKLGKNLADGNRRTTNLNPSKYVGLVRHLAIEANRDVTVQKIYCSDKHFGKFTNNVYSVLDNYPYGGSLGRMECPNSFLYPSIDGLYGKLNVRRKQTDFLALLLCLPPSTLELPFYSPSLPLAFRIAPIIAALSSNTHSSGRSPFNPST